MRRRTVSTRCADRVLVSSVEWTPVDEILHARRQWVLAILIALVVGLVGAATWRFTLDRPVTYESIEEHFKYGSIGSEPGGSVAEPVGGMLPPYDVFRALPGICPELLPGGYESIGLLQESGHDLPIGVSRRRILGFDQVGINCAMCHTGTYRDAPEAPHHVVLGMPANQLQLQRLFQFIMGCTLDERFTADNVIAHIEQAGTSLGVLDRLLYRMQLVPAIRETSERQRGRVGLIIEEGSFEWGPGRVDTFNPYKAIQFHWNLGDLPREELVAASDYPSLWNQRPRDGLRLHWDGNNSSVDERNLSAALGAGVTPVTVDHASIKRVRDWIWTLPPPKYPYPIDTALAARGEPVYRQHCYSCHGGNRFRDGEIDPAVPSAIDNLDVATGARLGAVTLLADVGTDDRRWASYTDIFAANQYTLYPSSTYRFRHFRKTGGYANQPLDGIWLRAPYLHNGSVPTLRDLLEPVERRPAAFYRGYDVYDRDRVGFASDRAFENGTPYWRYDTKIEGNRNTGHLYGTSLTDDEKKAVVEYLKTF
jgi:mono/diheme cytochrome c family protein